MRVAFLHPWVLALVLALAGAFPGAPTAAAAQDSAPGTEGAVPWEALVLDPAGARLLGHGLSDVGKLVLELGATFERFVLVLVGPQGTLERFEGYVDDDGTLIVSTDESGAPTLQTLEAVLERRGLALTVVRVRQDDASARREEPSGTPGGVPGDDDSGDDDSGDGEDGDGQDDGDQDGEADDADDGDDEADAADDEADDVDDATDDAADDDRSNDEADEADDDAGDDDGVDGDDGVDDDELETDADDD